MNSEEVSDMVNDDDVNKRSVALNPNIPPILYTDNVFVTVNKDGLVLDFAQKLGPTNPRQIRVVSRMGMSREHAKKLYKILGDQLKLVEGQVQTAPKVRN